MPNINIKIRNKVAKGEYAVIVCDNSDYIAHFDFDAEWDEYTTKTARFVYGGRYTDVVFSGNECPVPVIQDTRAVTVGVFAGDLHTTTPAYISCVPSILRGNGIPADPTPDVYNQIMELLNKESGIWYPAVDDAGNMSWTRSMSETEPQPVNIKGQKGDAGANGADGNDGISPAVSVAAITGGNRITITDAEGAKTFDVMNGARGEQGNSGADGKDYVLTDADKQEIAETAAGLVDVPSVQSDWNQNDSTQPDYVKNRPFYTGNPVETVLVEESTVSFAENQGLYAAAFQSTFAATIGETYKVYWDGTAYECTCVDLSGNTIIGNLSITGEGSDTGEPFVMGISNGEGIQIVTADTSASHTFSISETIVVVVKIDEKYLPDTVATKSEVEVAQSTANAAQSTANAAQTTADTAKTTADTAQTTADTAKTTADTAKTTADTAQSTADTAKTTADGCVKTNNSSSFSIFLGDNSYFSGSNSEGKPYYAFHQKDVTDTPIVLSIGTYGGTALDISVTPSTSPTVKITPPTYMDKLADIEIGGYSGRPRPQITGLGGITMYSSTAGSTKKFKITVDDSGTITATEVS